MTYIAHMISWSRCLSVINSTKLTSTCSKHVHILRRRSSSSTSNLSHRSRRRRLAMWYTYSKLKYYSTIWLSSTSNLSHKSRRRRLAMWYTYSKFKYYNTMWLSSMSNLSHRSHSRRLAMWYTYSNNISLTTINSTPPSGNKIPGRLMSKL